MAIITTNSSARSLSAPLKSGSVVLQVIDRIKEALISGELKPGDFIPSESELTRNLGVGKSTVREATKMLQALGVLEVVRGQGTRVCKEPPEDSLNSIALHMILAKGITKDVFELRKIFEPAYTMLAIDRANDDDIESIRAALEEFEDAINQGVNNASHDMKFHKTILRATHNTMIISIGETMMDIFAAALETSMRTLPYVALKDHKAIFQAICDRDKDAAIQAINASCESWETSLTYR